MPPNDRDYARWRFAGVFPVAKRPKEMRAQMRQQAHQSPNAHRRVLGANCLFIIRWFSVVNSAEILFLTAQVSVSFLLKSNR